MSNDEKITQVTAKVPQEYIPIITAEQRCNGYVTIEEVVVQHFQITQELGNLTMKMNKARNHPRNVKWH